MTAVPIDRGVPLAQNRAKYPWRGMRIGDSFLVTDGVGVKSAAAMATNAAVRMGGKFSARIDCDGRVRIWRVR